MTLVLSSHSEGGLTQADLDLAQRISDIAGIDHAAGDDDSDGSDG